MTTRHYGLVGVAILLGGIVVTSCGTTAHPVASASPHQSHTGSPAPAIFPATSPTPPSSSTSTSTMTTPSSRPVSPSPTSSSSESSHTGLVSPSSSSSPQASTSTSSSTSTPISLSSITYTTKQQATIFQLGHKVGFPAAYVPRQGFQSQFVRATLLRPRPLIEVY